MHVSDLGLIQVYTGTGKGKTTAALGLAMRACGHGLRAYMVQFMKGRIDYGELKVAERIEGLTIEQFGRPDFVDKDNPAEEDIELAREALARSKEIVLSGEYDLVILDEINVAVSFGLIALRRVIDFVKKKPPGLELILTGRFAPDELIEIADTVTEMREVRHHYQKGIKARKGIEY
ncbi:MAG: cob(I)yrinic acid a,c-diamide adenosyltransferase [Candidatus Krumholzibacteria bacterium]|nr:cob(I)yrinic acid a,c-diamide adenosyltransferase [Candidatus Krumholzibacteria bacterium]